MFPGEKAVLTEQNPIGGRKAPRLEFVTGKTAYDIGRDSVGTDFLDVLCQETDDWAVAEIIIPPFLALYALLLLPLETSVGFELCTFLRAHAHVGHVGEGTSPPFGASCNDSIRDAI